MTVITCEAYPSKFTLASLCFLYKCPSEHFLIKFIRIQFDKWGPVCLPGIYESPRERGGGLPSLFLFVRNPAVSQLDKYFHINGLSLCAGIKSINYALHIHFRFPPKRLTSPPRPRSPKGRRGARSERTPVMEAKLQDNTIMEHPGGVIISNQSQQLLLLISITVICRLHYRWMAYALIGLYCKQEDC